jgi:hypothetical protein
MSPLGIATPDGSGAPAPGVAEETRGAALALPAAPGAAAATLCRTTAASDPDGLPVGATMIFTAAAPIARTTSPVVAAPTTDRIDLLLSGTGPGASSIGPLSLVPATGATRARDLGGRGAPVTRRGLTAAMAGTAPPGAAPG